MELRRGIGLVRSWFWLFLAAVLLAAGAAYLVSVNLPKVYEAQSTLIVGQSLSAVNPDYNQLLASQRLSKTYADVATTRPILDKVSQTLSLGLSSEEMLAKVKASAPTDSTLVVVTATDGDPETAAKIANAVAAELIAASPAIQGQQSDITQFVATDLQNVQKQITAAQAEADRLTGLPTRTPEQDQQLATLQSQLITLRSTYATLLGLSSNSASNLLSVVDPAVAPAAPSSPRPLLNTLVAALVGLLIAVGIALTVEYLDDTVKTSADVEETAGVATLGAVGKIKVDRKKKELYRLQTLLYPRGTIAEGYRTLRTNLEFASVDRPLRTLVVTSAIPSEGKTTTAANLAVVFAQAGKRVVLLDGDLRKPGIHRIFDMPNSVGLSSLFRSDDVSVASVQQATEQDGLTVITSGALPPNPAELLGSRRFLEILLNISATCDLVIIDSPPLQAVADAAILASIADGTALVVYAGHTRKGAVRQAEVNLQKANARLLGVVLNRLSGKAQGQYYYYYSSYGYRGRDERAAADATATAPVSGPISGVRGGDAGSAPG